MFTQNVTADFRSLAVDQLRESPTNPRRSSDEGKLQELAQSIRAQGVLVPIIVRPMANESFEVVAGAEVSRGAAAELFAVPARVVELTGAEALTLQLVENAIREDVHPYEEAMAYRALLEASEPRYDVASLALKTGRLVNHIYGCCGWRN
jgi:ParB family chromosome partitioning protein